MKKTAGIFVILILTVSVASAQLVQFGVKGGVNFSKLKFDDIKNVTSNGKEYNLMESNAFTGFHVGVMTRVNLFSLFIQPELYFNTAGGKVVVQELQSSGTDYKTYTRNVKFSKIDLPVMTGLKVGPVRVNAGPVASIILSTQSGLNEIIPELSTMAKSATIGYQVGFGVDLFKFVTLDYRFEGSLSKWGDKITVGGQDYAFDSRGNMSMISLGILF